MNWDNLRSALASGHMPASGKVHYVPELDGVMLAWGTTVPADGTAGYAKSGIFLDTDSSSNAARVYVNQGSGTSCAFKAFTGIGGTGAALTAALTTLTHTAPSTPDYAIQELTQTTPFGFVTADEGESVLKVIANLQTRQNELESRLQALGILT